MNTTLIKEHHKGKTRAGFAAGRIYKQPETPCFLSVSICVHLWIRPARRLRAP